MTALAVVDRRHLLPGHPADAGPRTSPRSLSPRFSERCGYGLAAPSRLRALSRRGASRKSPNIDRELELARSGAEAPRGGVQHVLRRPAAASAVGDARPRRARWCKRLDSTPHHRILAARFRFNTLQSRFQTLHRSVGPRSAGARGRPSRSVRATSRPPTEEKPKRRAGSHPARDDVQRSVRRRWTSCTSCTTAWRRRGARSGEDAIPFHKFADLIKTQVSAFKEKGTPEVAFRVAVKHGKVAFTARAMKGDR